MSSKCPKFTTNTTRTKMFNIEKKASNYKPRFYTNKNLFFVKYVKKNNNKFHKKKFKLKFVKNRQNALLKRELRYREGLFITQQQKAALNSGGESSNNKINKLKRKLKFKFSVTKQTQMIEFKKNKIIENTTDFLSSLSNEENINKNIMNEEINNNLANKNIPLKKQKNINNENSKYSSGRWNLEEHKKFLDAIIKYGNDWKEVEKHIGTRSSSQARSHAQKFFIKLKQEQSKAKISNMIDYSNSTIQSFHDALQALTPDKKTKIIQELESVVFDKQISNKKRRRNKRINYSESITEMGFISGTDWFDDETFNLENKKDERKMSVDSLSEDKLMDKRKYINEIENNTNGIFTDEEYEKSFHKVFSDKEGNDNEVESRKQSIEDDFIFNNIKV